MNKQEVIHKKEILKILKGLTANHKMYIVVYAISETLPSGSTFTESDWSTHETFEDAKKEYEALLDNPSIYTASICGVIESTDY